jgi:hypothetical protein
MTAAREFPLSDDHEDVDVLLNDAIQKLEAGNAVDGFKALDLFWARLAMHIRAEHLHLLPAILKLSTKEPDHSDGEIPRLLELLRRDHDFFMHELADLIKAMRLITPESGRQTMHETLERLRTVKNRLAQHNSIEEEKLYPLHHRLSAADQKTLSQSIGKELDNQPPRFSR